MRPIATPCPHSTANYLQEKFWCDSRCSPRNYARLMRVSESESVRERWLTVESTVFYVEAMVAFHYFSSPSALTLSSLRNMNFFRPRLLSVPCVVRSVYTAESQPVEAWPSLLTESIFELMTSVEIDTLLFHFFCFPCCKLYRKVSLCCERITAKNYAIHGNIVYLRPRVPAECDSSVAISRGGWRSTRGPILTLGRSTGSYGCPGNWGWVPVVDFTTRCKRFISTLQKKGQSSWIGSILIASVTPGNINSIEGNVSWLRATTGKK